MTKINERFEIQTVLAWARNQKWFKDAVTAQMKQNEIDRQVGREMKERESEWASGSLAVKRARYNDLLKEVKAKYQEVE